MRARRVGYEEKVPVKFGQLGRPPRVYVEVSRPFYTKAEAAALTAANLDALVYALETLKPPKKIS